jgi:Holliday junction resolvasome RuvABC endonuclease subunit
MRYPLVAIDPGLNALGWALWEGPSDEPTAPCAGGVITASRKLPPWDRLKSLTAEC